MLTVGPTGPEIRQAALGVQPRARRQPKIRRERDDERVHVGLVVIGLKRHANELHAGQLHQQRLDSRIRPAGGTGSPRRRRAAARHASIWTNESSVGVTGSSPKSSDSSARAAQPERVAAGARRRPSRAPPWKRMAAGTASQADGSRVPSQRRRVSKVVPSSQSQLRTSGSSSSCRSGRAQRNPAPFGAHSHLWQLPA